MSQGRSATRVGSSRCLAAQLGVLRSDGSVSLDRYLDTTNALRLGPGETTETISICIPGVSMIFPAVSNWARFMQSNAGSCRAAPSLDCLGVSR